MKKTLALISIGALVATGCANLSETQQRTAIGTGVGAVGDLTSAMGNAFVRGYGRDMELEADQLGAQLPTVVVNKPNNN